jgi:uncharacterized Zn finger protein
MPDYICEDCGYETYDAWVMKRHKNRKYPCNSIGIVSKEKIEIVKKDEVNIEPKPKKEIKYKMKIDIENPKNNKLEKI